ncbi:LIM/homeobox protein Lhx9-like [Argiope bruennichi]|uniref:LIM/homeobox protein Lhx9-like n=1 Tax=Argiope bruennichi TaxID=94029 RepID=UPI002494689E|nr:LIM/homeobox protein Lhx9-like [Argiope bruennichi]
MVSGGVHFGGMPVISPGGYETPPPPSNCAGCGYQIKERYYLNAADRQWHVACLKCYRCNARLDQAMSCYYRDGHIYCKDDYFRLVAVKRCSRCQNGIYASELVMRVPPGLVFHLHCFTCAWCNTALTQGDYFGLRDTLVYCKPHYEMLVRDHYAPSPHHPLQHPDAMEPGGYGPYAVEPPTGRKGRPRKKKNADPDALVRHGAGLSPMDPTGINIHLNPMDGSNNSPTTPPLNGTSGTQRTKRMRTSFKHHQLRTMKSYFAINQNPDAKDLKQLSLKTGLNKRVLQVWFQNARAKWRRNNNKQEPGQPGMISNEQSPNSQMQQIGLMSSGLCSPGATSSYSEPSPVHSIGGVQSDGSISTQVGPGQSMDFDSSNPLTPLVNHHGHNPNSVHNGESVLHLTTSFQDMF